MNTPEVTINPAILAWAISRAGIGMDEVTKSFPRLPDWLSNQKKPTLRQLEDFSKKVHLPFGYLLLDTPPVERLPFPHFRTGKGRQDTVSVNMRDAIQNVQQRQQWLVDYLEESGNGQPLPFVGKFTTADDALTIANDIRAIIGLQAVWTAAFTKTEEAIGYLTEKIEEAGIYTVFNGCVENNTHRPIDVDECRGFVMVHPLAPFMFINNTDGKAAQLFTLLHELAHIWLGKSAGFDNQALMPANDPLEILCDAVAAELFVPVAAFREVWAKTGNIPDAARQFKASNIMIARRAKDLGKITAAQFFDWYNNYKEQLEKHKEAAGGGGDFYNTAKRRVGLRFAAFIDRAVREGQLRYKDAYRLTGLKGETYQTFMVKNMR